MSTFFTADSHWGHASILRHAHRPFASLDEMNAVMLARWNAVVRPHDVVYHLGDVSFRSERGLFPGIFAQLRGIKHLLRGNHDNDEVLAQPWASIGDIRDIKLDGCRIVLCHYPMRSWNGMYRGTLHLYGHEHGRVPDHANCADVGVDRWDFAPATLAQLRHRMAPLTPWRPTPAGTPHTPRCMEPDDAVDVSV